MEMFETVLCFYTKRCPSDHRNRIFFKKALQSGLRPPPTQMQVQNCGFEKMFNTFLAGDNFFFLIFKTMKLICRD